MEQINAIVEANPDATCGDTLVMFGQVLRGPDAGFAATVRDIWIHAWRDEDDGLACVLVSSRGETHVQAQATGRTYAEAERAWLEVASLEAPRLANRVLDLMGGAHG